MSTAVELPVGGQDLVSVVSPLAGTNPRSP